jgi:prepilin-type N-terminal cleavage/methylation domain-containing protein
MTSLGSRGYGNTSCSGYSLIELLIAIVLMGILASTAIYRLSPSVQHARVNRAANVVAGDLQYAQLLAVRQRRPVVLLVNNSVKSYIIRMRDTALTFRDQYFGPDTDYVLDQFTAAPSTTVQFFPNGVTTGTTTFTLALGSYTRHVRVTRAGQVRIVP